MAPTKVYAKQNVTIRLDRKTVHSAKIIAVRRSMSLSALFAGEIERAVAEEETYERSKRRALALLDKGFHLGGEIRTSRDELHER
jgi:hypothetical protein